MNTDTWSLVCGHLDVPGLVALCGVSKKLRAVAQAHKLENVGILLIHDNLTQTAAKAWPHLPLMSTTSAQGLAIWECLHDCNALSPQAVPGNGMCPSTACVVRLGFLKEVQSEHKELIRLQEVLMKQRDLLEDQATAIFNSEHFPNQVQWQVSLDAADARVEHADERLDSLLGHANDLERLHQLLSEAINCLR